MRKEVNFLNLTNGLEFIDMVDNPQFMRIRSTTLERKDFIFLLMDLDHNFLMNVALGNWCRVYDCGTNRPLSKTIYLGVPFIKYALERRWLGKAQTPYRFSRNGKLKFNMEKEFDELYEVIFVRNQDQTKKKLKKKLDYYKKFINTKHLYIQGVSISTDMDGKNDYWVKKVLKFNTIQ